MIALTRRDWLRGVSTLALAGAAEAPSPIRFGFSLYGMKTLATADALRVCAEIGYDGVELALMPGWPTEPKRLSAEDRRDLRKRLADSGLALVGLMENLSEPAEEAVHRGNLERLRAAADLGQALSPGEAPVIETILGGKPAQWDMVKGRLAERLRAWAKVATAAKTVIAIKPHVANALHTPEGARWLLEQVESPWLKLAFDYSHFVLRGLPLARTLAELIPHSRFIHVKDAKGNAGKFEFLLPGEGTIDHAEYFRLLRKEGYRGPIVVEVSGQISGRPGYLPGAAARRSYAALAPALRKAELRSR
jgi:inosose dehydratase